MKKLIFAILMIVAGCITPVSCITRNIRFSQECGGYLKQTADANTAEIALERLNKALEYIEANNLTDGYTSVLWRTENDNIGFWYQNLKACQSELKACIGGTQLEKSNVLMKVRESLTDNGEDGTKLTLPGGIARYPNNGLYMLFGWLSFFVLFAGVVWFFVIVEEG